MIPVLIGSRALSHWTGMPIKDDIDWDVISEYPIEGTEHHPLDKLNNLSMANYYVSDDSVTLPDGSMCRIMTMEGLAIIKRSHLWRDLKFSKNITHYHKWGLADVDLSQHSQELLKHRTELTMQEYPRKHPNLMQTKEDFFSDGVKKVYDHDWLHELFAYNERPMYTRMLTNPDMAWCSEDLWNEFSFLEKCQCTTEEVYVITTERFMIPSDWEYNSRVAYIKALEKVCTTLCSGFFRSFAIDNYPKIFEMYTPLKFISVQSMINTTPEESRIYHEGNVK